MRPIATPTSRLPTCSSVLSRTRDWSTSLLRPRKQEPRGQSQIGAFRLAREHPGVLFPILPAGAYRSLRHEHGPGFDAIERTRLDPANLFRNLPNPVTWQSDRDVAPPLLRTTRSWRGCAQVRSRFPSADSFTPGEKERATFLDAESVEDRPAFPRNAVECARRRWVRIILQRDSCRTRGRWSQQRCVVHGSRIDSEETRQSRGVLHADDALAPRDHLKDFRIRVHELAFRRRQIVAAHDGEERNGETDASRGL